MEHGVEINDALAGPGGDLFMRLEPRQAVTGHAGRH